MRITHMMKEWRNAFPFSCTFGNDASHDKAVVDYDSDVASEYLIEVVD